MKKNEATLKAAAEAAWTAEAKVLAGDENATADFTNFAAAVEEDGEAAAAKYAPAATAGASAGDTAASSDADSTTSTTTSTGADATQSAGST